MRSHCCRGLESWNSNSGSVDTHDAFSINMPVSCWRFFRSGLDIALESLSDYIRLTRPMRVS